MIDRFISSADGTRLAVRDHGGNGPDILLLHGRSRALTDWATVTSALDGVRCVSMDLRWHGWSDAGGSVSIDALLADIDAVIAATALRRPLLVGHSMGGVIGTYYGATRADCAGVINIDGLDWRMVEEQDDPELFRQMQGSRSVTKRRSAADSGDEDWRRSEIQRLRRADDEFGVPKHVTEALIERVFVQDAEGAWQRKPPLAFYELGLGEDTEPLDIALERTSCPTIVILCTGRPKTPSERDRPMSVTRSAMLRKLKPLADASETLDVRTMDGSHAIIWEMPDEIASITRSLA